MNQREVIGIIESFLGQANILTTPRIVLILLDNNHDAAIFVSQLLYWQSRTKDGWVAKSYDEWEHEIGIKRWTLRRIIRWLREKGLVRVEFRKFAGRPVLHFNVNREKFLESLMLCLNRISGVEGNLSQSRVTNCHGPYTETITETQEPKAIVKSLSELVYIPEETAKRRYTKKRKTGDAEDRSGSQSDDIPYATIIALLNVATDSSFRLPNNTRTMIRARWKEGYRLEDFKKVINNMTTRWGKDPKMSVYLRPQTLFSPKFDSYLNVKGVPPNGREAVSGGVGRSGETPTSQIGKYSGVGTTIDLENGPGSMEENVGGLIPRGSEIH